MNLDDILKRFKEIYGDINGTSTFFSPGRVNLIGEHVDYNEGYVFPCALSLGTYGIARKRKDNLLSFASTNFSKTIKCSIYDLKYEKKHGWANYLKGIVYEFLKLGYTLNGIDILISGNIPNGAGLSSSASIELLMCILLKELFKINIDKLEMVKLSQRAENNFAGVNCGIMDQYAVCFGKKDQAMLLDCKNIKHEYIPFILKGYKLVIANTNKRRSLFDSKYNERREECESAVKELNKKLNIKSLGDVNPSEFEEHKYLIEDPISLKRATHVIYEIERTLAAAKSLKNDDIASFGRYMIDSHNSLRDLYEVTGDELDTLVYEALKTQGVLGSRMTGAGFGGCTISIVKEDVIDDFIKNVGENYTKKIGYSPSFYIADIGDGAKKI